MEGPAIKMDILNLPNGTDASGVPWSWGSRTFNFGSTSNTFRMVQGQAIEADPTKKPVEPQDPSNGGDPAWSTYDQATKSKNGRVAS